MQRLHALLAEEPGDGGDGAGGGAPGGEEDKGKPDDKDFVPKKQMLAALSSAERKREAESAALQGRIDALEAQVKANPADKPKQYTRAELNALVADGKISQDQADERIDAQSQQEAETRAERVALNTVSLAERNKLINSEVARYKAVAPEILDESHETRGKIREAYDSLIALGDDPRDVATQVKAIRQVLGPVDKLERARSGRFQAEHHQETGGGDGGGQQKTGKKLVDQLPAETRRYYEQRIERGTYKDWAEVESELKYAKPATKQRLGIA